MRSFYTLLLTILSFNLSFAQVVAGDIAFTGINTSGTDAFSFIVLNDLPANSVIRFSDGGWKASGGFRCFEGDLAWNSGSVILPKGTQINLSALPYSSHGSFTAYSISSTCNANVVANGFLDLATLADQVIAYTGSFASPTVIAAVNVSMGWDADATDSQTSANPNVSTGFDLCLTTTKDNAMYNGPTTGTPAQILAAINTLSNWSTSNTPYTLPVSSAVLPLEWLDFKAEMHQSICLLEWETGVENNVAYFEIQHATNAIDFETLAQVKSRGAAQKSAKQAYSYQYLTPSVNVQYYRIRQVDVDGKASFSKTVSVLPKAISKLTVYPTLVSDKLTFTSEIVETQTFQVFNLFGQNILAGSFTGQKELAVNGLSAGTYVLKVGSSVVKFVKN
jgi:hypothetical protein